MQRLVLPSLLLAGSLAASPLLAQSAAPGIVVSAPWLRATPHGAPVAGGYATITNKGTTPDRLVAASLPIAPKGEIHEMSMDHGVMHMARLDKGLAIAPGQTVTLTPGGYHLMFMKPTAQLKPGESVKGTLTFEKAGTIAVTFAVAGMAAKTAPGAPAPKDDMRGMDMKGGGMRGMDMKGH
jgi:copper(I)-binding protein